MAYDGGFYLHKSPLIRSSIHAHTAAVEGAISQTTLDALNAIQATPWRINRYILDVMTEAWTAGDLLGDLPSAHSTPLPGRMDDALWERLDDEAKRAHKAKIAEVHGENASLESGRISFLDKLTVAQEMRDRDAIWFPHSVDFRGRVYPIVTCGPQPQGDGISRSLLMFAEGKALGDTGLWWLCIRAAGCYGQDKLALEDRVQWVMDHMQEIEDSARNPLDGGRFWAMTGEDPWGFLATCHELSQAFALSDPRDFVSHLPVPMDGTCNGLQHLSAMGRDPVGAHATNLTADAERQDIYLTVAAAVSKLVQEDALAGDEIAVSWVGKVGRSTVKRAVMTTPYGVTDRGIRDQLLGDKQVEGERENRSRRAEYLTDKIVIALAQTVTSAKEIMAWLQGVAQALAKHEQPFRFTTPTGNVICQSYYQLARRTVQTLMGKCILWEEEKLAGLNARKQALASAPNLIHAFDASHCCLTVNAGVAQGITAWAMIHDSFGAHATDTGRLNVILRETFIAMYADTDWLERVEAGVLSYCPQAELPARPTLGAFDVSEVRESRFFFS